MTFEDVGFKKERQRGLMRGGLQSRQAGSESESACWELAAAVSGRGWVGWQWASRSVEGKGAASAGQDGGRTRSPSWVGRTSLWRREALPLSLGQRRKCLARVWELLLNATAVIWGGVEGLQYTPVAALEKGHP